MSDGVEELAHRLVTCDRAQERRPQRGATPFPWTVTGCGFQPLFGAQGSRAIGMDAPLLRRPPAATVRAGDLAHMLNGGSS
jgi:hypothetical protein